jgi:mannose-6-phosphate isomerase-like protein (cupin superfamily)
MAEVHRVVTGDGYAAAHLDAMGDGPGFRKVRRVLDVTAFGVNAVVLPVGAESGFHYHDEQQELYFVHRGRIEFVFGDGSSLVLGPGGFVRVDPSTSRKLRNVGDEEAIYVCAGGKDGYVGRDAHVPEGDKRVRSTGGGDG